MRLKAKFSGLFPPYASNELVAALRKVLPDGKESGLSYDGEVYIEDTRYDQVRSLLSRAGMGPREGIGPIPQGEYLLRFEREYDASDFADCDYLEFIPRHVSKLWAGASDGITELNRGVLRSAEAFLSEGGLYAADRAKRLLEAESFKGLLFKPTRLRQRVKRGWDVDETGPEISWKDFGPPWWEMVPERVMPSLSPWMTLISAGRPPKVVQPPLDPTWSYTAKEGLYTPTELHYRAGDLANAEPFDYAHLLENVGRHGGAGIIVSKRFYDFCQDHELKADWVPVRIDPD